jgi:hypothetical protein
VVRVIGIEIIGASLLQFRQAIDNSQPYLISHLHLHHFGGETFMNPMGILHLKLNLSATSLNEVKEQQVRDVLQFVVTRVRTHVQDLGHWSGSSLVIRPAPFMPNILLFHNDPKEGGKPGFAASATPLPVVPSRPFALALQWLTGGSLLAACGSANRADGLQYYFKEGGSTNQAFES